ncbi:MFS transporter (macronuclear) [Tetrahymena thermophila SB210]|uniref:MFS transporter n=1 Tax=Tetrahymena thermophila (strain SB210) TaxID=312017 RepID=Q23ZA5_TETTS|nr:MFS transporter [Tetrahymena thermophila SB210]EAS01866.2 MFS transporter [Tetrahymena thermophila SB210]|eukprot:XP_001022111.2 MFS transporter [Tetrahymena thermophila SB210]
MKILIIQNVVDTGTSQAVPHLSTNPALRRLTSEFEWDPVFSPQYGRQQKLSTLGLPKRSPTLVLTQPQGAQLRSSNGIRCFHLSMADNKINIYKQIFITITLFNLFYHLIIYNLLKQINISCRHWDFPSGPPPQYQPSLKALNFGVRMGSGVFTLVWPTTKQNNTFQMIKNNINQNKKGCRHWDFPSGPPPQYQPSLKALNFGVRMGSGCRHWDFPSGPPPQYQPSLKALNFGVRMGSGVFTLVWPTTKNKVKLVIKNNTFQMIKNNINQNKKGCRHWDFPSGPPPQYQPSLKALNFGVRMGSGVFTLVWPTTKVVDTGTSQAVPHLSTNPALRRLTSEFEWDPVFSPQYGRQQKNKEKNELKNFQQIQKDDLKL